MKRTLAEHLCRIGTDTICPAAVIMRQRLLLVGLRHYTADTWKPISLWTMPGGRCNQGETLECTVRRETGEEVGIEDLVFEDHMFDVPGAKEGDLVPLFFCRTMQDARLMEPHKFSEWRWVTVDDFANRVVAEPFINERARTDIVAWLRERGY